jgi:Na+-translocating ferredoxin:NAD+ oxidoreductase RnfC subunit
MPQIIHRYLYRERTEEAEKAGLDRCVDCNLCTYVCPSKIELKKQFSEAKQLIRREREEMLAVAAKSEAAAEVLESEGPEL